MSPPVHERLQTLAPGLRPTRGPEGESDFSSSNSLEAIGDGHPAPSGDSYSAERDPHGAMVKLELEQTREVATTAQLAAMAPPAPGRASIGPAGRQPIAGPDPGGVFGGTGMCNGSRRGTVFGYGSENWFSVHTEMGWRAACGDETHMGGFFGTDGQNFGQVTLSGTYFSAARRIGTRLGGGVFVSPKKTTVDVTDTLPPDRRPSGDARLLRTTHVRPRVSWSGALGLAALSFLRLFLRFDRKRPLEVIWDRLESDPAKVREATGAGRNRLVHGMLSRARGFASAPEIPALRDCMTRLADGESLTYRSGQQNQKQVSGGLFAIVGRQSNALNRAEVRVAKNSAGLTVTLTRTTDEATSWFGIFPGGALTSREWRKPGVETWTYTFQQDQERIYQELMGAAFHPDRGILANRLNGDLCAEQRVSHVWTERGEQSHHELGAHVLQPRWMAKRWLPEGFALGLGNHTGKLETAVHIDVGGTDTVIETIERRHRATRGAQGLQQAILTSRLIHRADGNLAGARLLLRVKHKHSNSTPQDLDRTVLQPLQSLLGAAVGGLSRGDTPALAGHHAVNVGLDVKAPQLVALARFSGETLTHALPNDRQLREALQRCIDDWGDAEAVARDPMAAFRSLRELMTRTADRSAEDAALLLGALGYLLDQADHPRALHVAHKAALYRAPAKRVAALQSKYRGKPIVGLKAVRARFCEVRQALVQVDYARQLLNADTVMPALRDHYAPALAQAVDDLRALLHVASASERESLVRQLQSSWWRGADDDYIITVLCAQAGDALFTQDPLREARDLLKPAAWNSFGDTDLRKRKCQALDAALEAHSARMGEPGFPYSIEDTRALRRAARTEQYNLRRALGGHF